MAPILKPLSTEVNIAASIHDQTQIELDFEYSFLPRSESITSHSIFNPVAELYFFLPNSLAIHPDSYSRDQFYNDLTNYTRFRAPEIEGGGLKLIEVLSKYFAPHLSTHDKEKLVPLAVQQVKLFGNRINSQLKDLYNQVSENSDSRTVDSGNRDLRSLSKAGQLIQDIKSELYNFQEKYVEAATHESLLLNKNLQQAIMNTDEFLCNRTISTFSGLHILLKSGNLPNTSSLLIEVDSLLHRLATHRKQFNYLSIESQKSSQELEYFYYRYGLLKKFLSRPLHISKNSSKQERVYRNWIAGAGAGLAGLWAQIADYQAKKFAYTKDVGLNFLTIALAAIIVYVFKDRIKDLAKEYFNEKLKSYLPDFKTKLYYSYVNSNAKTSKVQIGFYQEYMRYLKAQSCPQDVFYVRKMKGRRDIGEEVLDTILHYCKTVSIDSNQLQSTLTGVFALKDIWRFNFNYFLDHLDDPNKLLSTFDIEDGPGNISAPKVYHINLILKVTSENQVSFAHYRLIIDKKGIVRIEEVSGPSSLTYKIQTKQ